MPRAPFRESQMNLVKKILSIGGNDETVYFRELTAGEQLDLLRGVRSVRNKDGNLEFDFAANVENGMKLLQKTYVTEAGELVYRNLEKLRAEPAKRIAKLIQLANEVVKDDEPAGNV
jgi:hypothetical protein